MNSNLIKLSIGIFPLVCAAPGFAKENCSPAIRLVSAAQSFYGEAPELKNQITPIMNISLKGINGHPDPSALLYRYGETEVSLPIVDDTVQGLDKAINWSKDGELCSIYPNGPLPQTEDETVSLSVGFAFPFNRTDGVFTYDEIKEGLKDGSKIMKSLAPKGLGFAAPGLKTFLVSSQNADDPTPTISFLKGEEIIEVPVIKYDRQQFIRLKDLKTAKIDRLKIKGAHDASAFFKIDPEKMAIREAERLAKLAAGEESEN